MKNIRSPSFCMLGYLSLTKFLYTVGIHVIVESKHFTKEICDVLLYCFIQKPFKLWSQEINGLGCGHTACR